MATDGSPSLQLLDGQGVLNESGLESFTKAVKLPECGLSYAVVAIMGPQSSGKSTLMNHLFHTKFREMDAFAGRNQTTQGVWLARAVDIDPCTIVMDLEGTDGRERGEDDTAFEKQSALFALAVADIVLINMWCHDIGREHAANKPLLKTVFQVMTRLFTPRKTTLLFVIRDKTRTPMEVLEPILRADIQKIWDTAPKPPKYQGTELVEFFNVQVTSLSNFEEKPEKFSEEVADMGKRFINSIAPGGLAGDRRAVVPASGFSVSIKQIWEIIKSNKDLDLPAHKVMVATVRCEEIAHEKLQELLSDEEWHDLDARTKEGPVTSFGRRLTVLLDKYISDYDAEATYFDEHVRTAKRNFLLSEALESVQHAHSTVLGHARTIAFTKFKQDLDKWSVHEEEGFADAVRRCTATTLAEFDKASEDAHVPLAQWDSEKPREKLRRDLDGYTSSTRSEKLADLVASFEERLDSAIRHPTQALLDSASENTWPALRQLLSREIESVQADLASALSGFEFDASEEATISNGLATYARKIVDMEARKEAGQALLRMKDRFTTVFSHDAEALPRVWSAAEDIRAITKDARAVAIKGLAVLAAIRLDEESSDQIEAALATLLNDAQATKNKSAVGQADSESSSIITSDPLAASSWDAVPASDTLITPVQCKSIWRQFKTETDYTIGQALAAQEASKNRSSWLPPPWAIAAMIILGFNEFMALLRNPLYILVGFVVYLLGKALYVQLDVSSEFRHGLLPGVISLSSKLLPTFMNILNKLAQEGQRMSTSESSGSSSNVNNNGQEFPMQNFAQGNMTKQQASVNGINDSGVRNRQQRSTVTT